MIEQLKTIREALEPFAKDAEGIHPDWADERRRDSLTGFEKITVGDMRKAVKALTALAQIEAMAGSQEPVAKLHDDGYWTPMKTEAGRALNDRLMRAGSPSIDVYATPVAQQYEAGDVASAAAQGFRDGVASVAQQPQKLEDVEQYRMQMAGISTAAIGYWKEGDPIHPDYDTPALRDVAKLYAKYAALYKAQQPQARPDFTDEWTGYLKDGETPFERFLRERKDLTALTKLYQRALEENERLKAQQPQAEPDDEILKERDDAEDFIDMLLDEVLGTDRPEWTSAYGRDDALRDVQERMTALHKPTVDKAWARYEKAQQPQALLIRERQQLEQEWCELRKLQAQYKQPQAEAVPCNEAISSLMTAAAIALNSAIHRIKGLSPHSPLEPVEAVQELCARAGKLADVAPQQSQAEAVPPAHVLVPVEPTEAMLLSARDWSATKYGKPIGDDAAKGCWGAMVAAAIAQQKGN